MTVDIPEGRAAPAVELHRCPRCGALCGGDGGELCFHCAVTERFAALAPAPVREKGEGHDRRHP